jgi:predicted ABC-type ATPase
MTDLKTESIKFIKQNKRLIIDKFITGIERESNDKLLTVFMAGSPGAGKTEFSKRFIAGRENSCVRIDADDIRELIPGYNGKNSDEVQSAASIGVEKLYDCILKYKYEAIIDGTLASYRVAERNIERALKRNRIVYLFYIYQDPIIAWFFTKTREKLEGRVVTKEIFIEVFFKAYENVNKLKHKFGNNIEVYVIEKNFDHDLVIFEKNVVSIDSVTHITYNRQTLAQRLADNV